MVAVCVGVEDEQPRKLSSDEPQPALDEVVDDAAQREELGRFGRPGVDEPQGCRTSGNERRLVVDRLVLCRMYVLVVRMDLDLGVVVLRRE
jgi:hypothetical protein